MSKYGKKLENFISNNYELVSEYEAVCGVPVDCFGEEIIGLFQKISGTVGIPDFNSILISAFKTSIKHNISIIDALEGMLCDGVGDNKVNTTQQYFKEINDIYNKHNNDYNISYCEENRDKLIEMNLKTVISIAKRYQGLGLTLEELISAGNLGLVIAYDKFDPKRSKLKDQILSIIEDLPIHFKYIDLIEKIGIYLEYGDIKKKFDCKFYQDREYDKQEVIDWVNSNVYNAKFNSIATMWIRAYILIEIDNYSRVVKKPKSEIYKDREKYGAYRKEVTLDIDAPVSNDTDTSFSELLKIEDETPSDLEVAEAYNIYKYNLNLLLDGVKPRDRSIFLKKFGIGLPRPMLPKEIADQEGLSIARVSQIFQTVLDQIQQNQVKYDINPDILFEATKKFR